MMKRLSVILLFLLAFPVLSFSRDDTLVSELQSVYKTYHEGYLVNKDNSKLEKAMTSMERLMEKYPEERLLKVFFIRIQTRKGLDAFWVWDKYRWTLKALRESVKLEKSGNLRILERLEFAKTYYYIPGFFGKRDTSLKYFQQVADELRKSTPEKFAEEWEKWQAFNQPVTKNDSPTIRDIRVALIQDCYFRIGKIHERNGDYEEAKRNMSICYSLDKSSGTGRYASLWLQYKKY